MLGENWVFAFFPMKKAQDLVKQLLFPLTPFGPRRSGLNANTFGVGVACTASDYLFR